MKYQKCEVSGCSHKAVKKLGNHWVCDDHVKGLRRRAKKYGKKAKYYFIEKVVGSIGGYQLCIDLPVKFK